MRQIMIDPDRLRERYSYFRNSKKRGRLNLDSTEAFAECCFRLAVHPDTPQEEAIRLLKGACRLDATSPKYPYHLARLYFRQGMLGDASVWLRRAAIQCPTSHRVWTHVGLLQKELNARYVGNERFQQDILRDRSNQIADRIKNGEDSFEENTLDFVPPVSLAQKEAKPSDPHQDRILKTFNMSSASPTVGLLEVSRLNSPGRCRWTGIYDLAVEDLLAAKASVVGYKKLLPLMVFTARTAEFRSGGVSAFVILSVQWLVSGYPVENITHLRKLLSPETHTPSLALLEFICDLWQRGNDEIPGLLASAIDEKRIPPGLAALIHQRRSLVGQLPDFRAFFDYRSAINYLKANNMYKKEIDESEQTKQAEPYIRSIEQAIKRSRSKAFNFGIIIPPAKESRVPEVTSMKVRLQTLETAVQELSVITLEIPQALTLDLAQLEDGIITNRDYTVALGVQDAYLAIFQNFKEVTEFISQELDDFSITLFENNTLDHKEYIIERRNQCRATANELTYFTSFSGILKDLDKKIAKADGSFSKETYNGCFRAKGIQTRLMKFIKDKDAAMDSETAKVRFEQLETAAKELLDNRIHAFEFLKKNLVPTSKEISDIKSYSKVCADRSVFEVLIEEFKSRSQKGRNQLENLVRIIADFANPDLVENFMERKEKCKNCFAEVSAFGKFNKLLNRIDKKIKTLEYSGDIQPSLPTEELAKILTNVKNALSPESHPSENEITDPVQTIHALSAQANEIKTRLNQYWQSLKTLVAVHENDELNKTQSRETSEIASFVESLPLLTKAAIAELEQVRQSGEVNDNKILELLDKTVTTFRNIRSGKFKAKLRKISQSQCNVQASNKSNENKSTLGAKKKRFKKKQQEDSGQATLSDLVDNLDHQIIGRFKAVLATFDTYSAHTRTLPLYSALVSSVQAKYAETLFRLEKRKAAGRIWNQMLRSERLDAATLKNIAINDTLSGFIQRSLQSWKDYVEMLYFYAVALGHPRCFADARVRFHRNFGNAYAPRCIFALKQNKADIEKDAISLGAFLDNTARLRAFVDHTILEALNAKLNFFSPLLILGVERGESQKIRQKAAEKMKKFAHEGCASLPKNFGRIFSSLIDNVIDDALEACSSSNRLTHLKDPDYTKELSGQIQWVSDYAIFKLRLNQAFLPLEDLLPRMSWRSCFHLAEQLNRLDSVPIDFSRAFLESVSVQIGQPPEMLVDTLKQLTKAILNKKAEDVFEESEKPAIVYEEMFNMWGRTPLFAVPMLDDPFPCYESDLDKALKSSTYENAITFLKIWIKKFPGTTGPARHLAIFLQRENRHEEACRVLNDVCNISNFKEGIEKCKKLLTTMAVQEKLDYELFDEALPLLLDYLNLDDTNANLAIQYMGAFTKLASESREDPGHEVMMDAVNQWMERARKAMIKSEEATEEEMPKSVTDEDLQTVAKMLTKTLIAAYIAPSGGIEEDENTNWKGVAHGLSRLIEDHGDIVDAYFFRMNAWYRHAGVEIESNRPSEARKYLEIAIEDATYVSKYSKEAVQRSNAADAAKKIGEMMARL